MKEEKTNKDRERLEFTYEAAQAHHLHQSHPHCFYCWINQLPEADEELKKRYLHRRA